MNEAIVEADLIQFMRGGAINALVLSEAEIAAAHRLEKRGAVNIFFNSGAHQLLGIWSVELAGTTAG